MRRVCPLCQTETTNGRFIACLLFAAASLAGPGSASAGGDLIEHTVQASGVMHTERWSDLLTHRSRSVTQVGGKLFHESVMSVVDGSLRFDMVDYPSRTWLTFDTGHKVGTDQGRRDRGQLYRDEVAGNDAVH